MKTTQLELIFAHFYSFHILSCFYSPKSFKMKHSSSVIWLKSSLIKNHKYQSLRSFRVLGVKAHHQDCTGIEHILLSSAKWLIQNEVSFRRLTHISNWRNRKYIDIRPNGFYRWQGIHEWIAKTRKRIL